MATLSGQSIQDTYDGLLKLEDSTQGISATPQPIQDGLGNNTGSRIATDFFAAPNVVGMNLNKLKPDAMGIGYAATGSYNPGGGAQGNLVFGYFYDPGVLSYSSLTMNVTTQTSTTDSVEMLFYDLQFVKDYGVFPRNQIMSGITLPSASLGVQTVTLPSTLSFSGNGGGGFYAYVLKYTNPGNVAPTVRYSIASMQVNNQSFAFSFGYVRNNAGTGMILGNRAQAVTGGQTYWFTGQQTPATITEADVASRFNTTIPTALPGFTLNTIK